MHSDKYRLLRSMQALILRIEQSRQYAARCTEGYARLARQLERLKAFIMDPIWESIWLYWEHDRQVAEYANRLRQTAMTAVCELEKYLSRCFSAGSTGYFAGLSHAVRSEVNALGLDASARIMLVGAGALPTTALVLARATGADIYGIDIDAEAVQLAQAAVLHEGLADQVQISGLALSAHRVTATASHFIVASMVSAKDQILADIARHMRPDAKILLRHGQGIKSLFNFQLGVNLSKYWQVQTVFLPYAYYEAVVLTRHAHD